MKNRLFLLFIFVFCTVSPFIASAHSGGTDVFGGHWNSSTGEYHYHHGYSAHDHYDIDGDGKDDCPKKDSKSRYREQDVPFWQKALSFIGIILIIPALLMCIKAGLSYIGAIFRTFIACLNARDKAVIKATHIFVCTMKILLTISVFVAEFYVYKMFTASFAMYFVIFLVSVALFFVFIELSNFEKKYADTLMFSKYVRTFNDYEHRYICAYLEELIHNKKQ